MTNYQNKELVFDLVNRLIDSSSSYLSSWLFNRCYVMSESHGAWWFMTTVHHDHDITWAYDRDMAITTRILPTQHLWWSTKIFQIHSWIIESQASHLGFLIESPSSWTSARCTGTRWVKIFTNGPVPAILMAWGVLCELCGHGENGAE